MYKVNIRPEAKQDIKNIWQYTFKTWGEKQADIYTTELGVAINSLVDNPEIGFTIDHIKDGYRLYRFRHHFVIYTLSPVEIDVTRVLGENMYIENHI
ncbi:MAG: type II toxin-antitoxin system RelE/ParE family toxin [Gammaproteobacteria bacterium]|nr:type II toxin-antitoxin system RelE/ParE family toxin [Gammaproteobacteria bacterium]